MDEKKFIRLSFVIGVAILLIWIVIFVAIGQFSKVPLIIGSFVVGWYLRKIYDNIRDALRCNAGRSTDSRRSGKPIRAE